MRPSRPYKPPEGLSRPLRALIRPLRALIMHSRPLWSLYGALMEPFIAPMEPLRSLMEPYGAPMEPLWSLSEPLRVEILRLPKASPTGNGHNFKNRKNEQPYEALKSLIRLLRAL